MTVQDIADSVADKTGNSDAVDFITLNTASSILGRIASTIYGFLCVVIIISVPIIVGFELMYINFPFVRKEINHLLIEVEGKGAIKKVLGLTLRDARKAIKQAYTDGSSANFNYLKLKTKSVMFLCFIVALVLQGTVPIIQFVWRMVSNIITGFANGLFG